MEPHVAGSARPEPALQGHAAEDSNARETSHEYRTKRLAILEGAADVFLRRGYAAGTTKEIAAEVGLSQPTIYHYVGAKADLLREIAIHVTEEMTAALSTGLQRSEDPAERLRGVIEEFTAAVGRDRRSFAVFWQELHSLPSDLREEIARAERDYIRQIAEVISALQQTGDMPPGPTVVLARAVLSMPSWMYQWYDPDGPMTAAEIADVYCSLLRLPGGDGTRS
jgi:AcrR family transcriptional regulator